MATFFSSISALDTMREEDGLENILCECCPNRAQAAGPQYHVTHHAKTVAIMATTLGVGTPRFFWAVASTLSTNLMGNPIVDMIGFCHIRAHCQSLCQSYNVGCNLGMSKAR